MLGLRRIKIEALCAHLFVNISHICYKLFVGKDNHYYYDKLTCLCFTPNSTSMHTYFFFGGGGVFNWGSNKLIV
jgi:hypothetical protein